MNTQIYTHTDGYTDIHTYTHTDNYTDIHTYSWKPLTDI